MPQLLSLCVTTKIPRDATMILHATLRPNAKRDRERKIKKKTTCPVSISLNLSISIDRKGFFLTPEPTPAPTCLWKFSSLRALSSMVALVRKSPARDPGRFSSS